MRVRQPTVERATSRARMLFANHKGLQSAYVKGWRAARAKLRPDACPYLASGDGWGASWRDAWFRGYEEGTA